MEKENDKYKLNDFGKIATWTKLFERVNGN